MPWCIPCSVHSPTGQGAPGIPCLSGQPVKPAIVGTTQAEGPAQGVALRWPSRATCPPLDADWGAAARGWDSQQHAPSIMPLESIPPNTGSCSQEAKGSGQEQGG